MFFVSYKRPTQVQPCHKNETDNFMNDDEIGHSQFLHFFIGVHGGCPRRSVEIMPQCDKIARRTPKVEQRMPKLEHQLSEVERQTPELAHQPVKGERQTPKLEHQPDKGGRQTPCRSRQLPCHIRKESACRFLPSCLYCFFM